MDTLMTTLMENTKHNNPNRIKKNEETRLQRDNRLKEILDKLYDSIVSSDYEQTMIKASEEGYNSAVVYKYNTRDEFEGYRISFLLRGPITDRRNEGTGLDFFYYKDIEPVMDRLKKFFLPMHFFVKYDRTKKDNILIVSWKENNQLKEQTA